MTEHTKPRKRDVFRDLLTRRDKPESNPATASPSGSVSSVLAATPSQQTSLSQSSQSLSSTQIGRQFSEDALQTLSSDDQALVRKLLADNIGNITNAVHRAYEAAGEQRRVCEGKRWRVNFRGREIVLRDEADKVVAWVDRFKPVGDVVANLDPIHVGLPWAGIRVILEVAVAESRQMATLLTGMNLAMYMANRLRAYWDHFIRLPDTPTAATFEKSLVKMFVLVLRFLNNAIETYQKGSAMRTWTTLWKVSELDTFESKCKDWAVQVEIDASNCDRELHQQDRDGVSKWREDLERTLQRLEDQVASQQLTAYSEQVEARSSPKFTVPFLRDPDFVDRVELDMLAQQLSTAGTRVAMVGLGGVGKTQLAIEYCYRARDRSADLWVLWVHASTEARFEESIRKLADDAKIPGRKDARANIHQLIYDWLYDERRGKWLLVLDNADDAEFLFKPPEDGVNPAQGGSSERIAKSRTRLDYLPICAHGSILVTSRNRIVVGKIVDECKTFTIRPMDKEHALALLEKKLGQQDAGQQNDRVFLQKLAATLDYIPLAITQAAAYIKQRAPRCTVEQYLDKFEKSDRSRTSLLDTNSAELRRDREASNSVILTWQISFEHIRDFRRSAADLLSLMSFFDHQSIPKSVLWVEYVDKLATTQQRSDDSDASSDDNGDEVFENDILVLRNYHFVYPTPKTDAFVMHRLVQLAARRWLKSQLQYQQWAEQSIRNLDSVLPIGKYDNWDRCRSLYPHAKMALQLKVESKTANIRWASILHKAAWFAWQQGLAQEAEALARPARDARIRFLGDSDKDTLCSESLLALILQNQAKYEAAEEIHRRTLEGWENLLGKEHPETLISLNNLALVLGDQGKYEVAEEMHRRALEGTKKVLGKEHPSTLINANNLALVLRDQDKYEAAEEIFRQVLEAKEKVLGKEHPSTLLGVHNLGSVLQYQDQDNYKAAEEMYRRALEGREKILGKEHPSTLESVWHLASLSHKQKRYDAAVRQYEQACAGFEKALGSSHPTTVHCNDQLSLLRAEIGSRISSRI